MLSNTISLDTASIIADISKRTLWRRINDGSITSHDNDQRGRTMLMLKDIIPKSCISIQAEDYETLIRSDNGDSCAQNDLALLFIQEGRLDIALYWLNLAAEQGHADAMQLLSEVYAKGAGVKKCETTALMWLAKSAAHGHLIAKQQLFSLTGIGEGTAF